MNHVFPKFARVLAFASVHMASFDLAAIGRYRAEWGFFRDRRTDLYAKSIV